MKNVKPAKNSEAEHLARLEEERVKTTLDQYLKSGHPMPRSRREFLASGVMSFAGMIAVPSILQLISSQSQAAGLTDECAKLMSPSGGWMPYIQVNLGGGAALHSNLLPMDIKGQLLTGYDRVGLGQLSNFNAVNGFGNAPLAMKNGKYIGQLMQGLMDSAGTSAVAKTALVKFCVRSQDDSFVNRDSIMGLVNKLGLQGSDFPNLIAANGKIRNASALLPATSPQGVGSASGILAAISPGGRLKTLLSDSGKREALLKTVSKLNVIQRRKLASSGSDDTLGKLMECSAGKNVELGSSDLTTLDPRSNAELATLWEIDSTTADNNKNLVYSMIAFNVLQGRSGAGRLDLSGYDYHGQTREQQNAKDLDAGIVIGRLLKTAEIMRKPLFLHVTSDGSVEGRSYTSDGAFIADAGARGMGAIFAYSPTGRPSTLDAQIGHFNSSQSVDESFIKSWNVERSAVAVFANYLALQKRMDLFESMAPDEFDLATLKKLVKFV